MANRRTKLNVKTRYTNRYLRPTMWRRCLVETNEKAEKEEINGARVEGEINCHRNYYSVWQIVQKRNGDKNADGPQVCRQLNEALRWQHRWTSCWKLEPVNVTASAPMFGWRHRLPLATANVVSTRRREIRVLICPKAWEINLISASKELTIIKLIAYQ